MVISQTREQREARRGIGVRNGGISASTRACDACVSDGERQTAAFVQEAPRSLRGRQRRVCWNRSPGLQGLSGTLNTATPNFQNIAMTKDRGTRVEFLSFTAQANDPF